MSQSLITIWRISPSSSSQDQELLAQSRTSLTFDELKHWLETKEFLRHVFSHGRAVMRVYDLNLVGQPFATGLLLWLLARGKCVIRDDQGRESRITFFKLPVLFIEKIMDALKIPGLLGRVEDEVEVLSAGAGNKPRLDLSGRPVYLRTDLTFGLKSGGSVGHIAGVLNNLEKFAKPPLFLTTDSIPTVRGEIETRRITPAGNFWDFKEELTLAFNRRFFEWAFELLKPAKISFIYQRYSLNNFSGLKLAAQAGVPLALEFNGSEIWVGRQWEGGLKREALSEKIENLNLNRADLVVVVSKALRDTLVKQGVPDEKILVNPNGVETGKYSPEIDGSKVRAKWGLEGKTVIGFIGVFGKWHGTQILAEAFGMLLKENPGFRDSVRLLLIGEGEMLPRVREILRDYGVEAQTALTGIVPQAEGPTHLASCDILVSPTVPNEDGTPFFGSPTKLFEYMAMGKGIVASDLDQIGEVLKHDQTGWLVKPGDAESLKAGLKTLVEDESRRRRLGTAARKEVVAKHTWEEHTKKIIEKLKEVSGND